MVICLSGRNGTYIAGVTISTPVLPTIYFFAEAVVKFGYNVPTAREGRVRSFEFDRVVMFERHGLYT
jgi:hypothetical protein